MEKLLAPNGKPSNLTPEQYKLVRTPAFKQWFGDWEYLQNFNENEIEIKNNEKYVNAILNDDNLPNKIAPNTILFYRKNYNYIISSNDVGKIIGALTIYPNSKIDQFAINKNYRGKGIGKKMIDLAIENGAKLVAEHTKYSNKLINYFLEKTVSKVVDENGEPLIVYHGSRAVSKDTKFNIFKIGDGAYGKGIYFTSNEKDAKGWALGNYVFEVFLSIKNPFIEKYYKKWYQHETESSVYDGIIKMDLKDIDMIVAFEPNQIKLADGTNTTFDSNNPDIRYKQGGKVKNYWYKGLFN